MTYSPNIPQANDRIADSQPVLLTNFQQLNNVYGDPVGPPIGDHFAFNDTSANARKHRKVTLPDQTATPPATPGLGNIVIFSTLQDNNTFTRPYFIRDGVANTVQYPLSPVKCFCEFSVQPVPVITPNSWGVSSVTKFAVGRYIVVFVDPLPAADIGYSINLSLQGVGSLPLLAYASKTNTQFEVQLIRQDGSGFTDTNAQFVSLSVFRY